MAKHNGGKHYIDLANQNKLPVVAGKGDHMKIYSPDRSKMMVVPMHKELATGTEHAIRRWFRLLGIICILAILLILILLVAGV